VQPTGLTQTALKKREKGATQLRQPSSAYLGR
jgi:hypothetical protein